MVDGGNAIEFDIVWFKDDLRIGHGPLHVWDQLQTAEESLSELVRQKLPFGLAWVDCHVRDRRLGSRVLQLLRDHLRERRINVILSRGVSPTLPSALPRLASSFATTRATQSPVILPARKKP